MSGQVDPNSTSLRHNEYTSGQNVLKETPRFAQVESTGSRLGSVAKYAVYFLAVITVLPAVIMAVHYAVAQWRNSQPDQAEIKTFANGNPAAEVLLKDFTPSQLTALKNFKKYCCSNNATGWAVLAEIGGNKGVEKAKIVEKAWNILERMNKAQLIPEAKIQDYFRPLTGKKRDANHPYFQLQKWSTDQLSALKYFQASIGKETSIEDTLQQLNGISPAELLKRVTLVSNFLENGVHLSPEKGKELAIEHITKNTLSGRNTRAILLNYIKGKTSELSTKLNKLEFTQLKAVDRFLASQGDDFKLDTKTLQAITNRTDAQLETQISAADRVTDIGSLISPKELAVFGDLIFKADSDCVEGLDNLLYKLSEATPAIAVYFKEGSITPENTLQYAPIAKALDRLVRVLAGNDFLSPSSSTLLLRAVKGLITRKFLQNTQNVEQAIDFSGKANPKDLNKSLPSRVKPIINADGEHGIQIQIETSPPGEDIASLLLRDPVSGEQRRATFPIPEDRKSKEFGELSNKELQTKLQSVQTVQDFGKVTDKVEFIRQVEGGRIVVRPDGTLALNYRSSDAFDEMAKVDTDDVSAIEAKLFSVSRSSVETKNFRYGPDLESIKGTITCKIQEIQEIEFQVLTTTVELPNGKTISTTSHFPLKKGEINDLGSITEEAQQRMRSEKFVEYHLLTAMGDVIEKSQPPPLQTPQQIVDAALKGDVYTRADGTLSLIPTLPKFSRDHGVWPDQIKSSITSQVAEVIDHLQDQSKTIGAKKLKLLDVGEIPTTEASTTTLTLTEDNDAFQIVLNSLVEGGAPILSTYDVPDNAVQDGKVVVLDIIPTLSRTLLQHFADVESAKLSHQFDETISYTPASVKAIQANLTSNVPVTVKCATAPLLEQQKFDIKGSYDNNRNTYTLSSAISERNTFEMKFPADELNSGKPIETFLLKLQAEVLKATRPSAEAMLFARLGKASDYSSSCSTYMLADTKAQHTLLLNRLNASFDAQFNDAVPTEEAFQHRELLEKLPKEDQVKLAQLIVDCKEEVDRLQNVDQIIWKDPETSTCTKEAEALGKLYNKIFITIPEISAKVPAEHKGSFESFLRSSYTQLCKGGFYDGTLLEDLLGIDTPADAGGGARNRPSHAIAGSPLPYGIHESIVSTEGDAFVIRLYDGQGSVKTVEVDKPLSLKSGDPNESAIRALFFQTSHTSVSTFERDAERLNIPKERVATLKAEYCNWMQTALKQVGAAYRTLRTAPEMNPPENAADVLSAIQAGTVYEEQSLLPIKNTQFDKYTTIDKTTLKGAEELFKGNTPANSIHLYQANAARNGFIRSDPLEITLSPVTEGGPTEQTTTKVDFKVGEITHTAYMTHTKGVEYFIENHLEQELLLLQGKIYTEGTET